MASSSSEFVFGQGTPKRKRKPKTNTSTIRMDKLNESPSSSPSSSSPSSFNPIGSPMKVQKVFNLLEKNQDAESTSPTESSTLSPRTYVSNSTLSLPDDGNGINSIRQGRLITLFGSTGPFGSTISSSTSDIPITAHMSSMNDMATMHSINPSSGKQSPPTWSVSHASSSIDTSTIDGQVHGTSIFSKLTSGSLSTFDALRNSIRSPTRQPEDRQDEGVDGSDHEEKSSLDSFGRRRLRSKGSPGGLMLPSSISSPTNRFLTSAMLYEDAESGHDNSDVTGRLSALQVGKTQSRTLLLNDDDEDDVNVIPRGRKSNNSNDGNINSSWKMTSSLSSSSSSASNGFVRPRPQRPLFQSPSSSSTPAIFGVGLPFNHGSRDRIEGIHSNPHLDSNLGSPLPAGKGSPADMDMGDQYVAEEAMDGGFKFVIRDKGQTSSSSSSSSSSQQDTGLCAAGLGTDRTRWEYLRSSQWLEYDHFDQNIGQNFPSSNAGENQPLCSADDVPMCLF